MIVLLPLRAHWIRGARSFINLQKICQHQVHQWHKMTSFIKQQNSVRRKPEQFISSFKGGLNVIQSFTLKQVKPTAKWVIIFLIIQWHYKYYIPYYTHKIYKMVSLVAQINYIAHHIYTNKKTSERHKRRSRFNDFKSRDNTTSSTLQGYALWKIRGSPVLWNCKI